MHKLCLLLILFVLCCAPKRNEPYNKHFWRLSNGDIIQYFEMRNGKSGFTANLFQYLSWKQNGGLEKKYLINIGGSHKALELLTSNDGQIIWIVGKYAGSKIKHLIAALDLVRCIFLGYDKLKWNEDDLNGYEKTLKRRIMIEKGTRVSEETTDFKY